MHAHQAPHSPHVRVREGRARLAVIGDSIAEGLGDGVSGDADRSWPALLIASLRLAGSTTDLLNLGARGQRAREVREAQLLPALRFRPDVAVVCAGGNDVLGRTFTPEEVSRELEEIIGRLADAAATVVTFGLFDLSAGGLVPPPARPALRDRILTLNRMTQTITARHRGLHVDFFHDLSRDPSLLSADLVHPNRRGHAHIAAAVFRALVDRADGYASPLAPARLHR